MIEVVGAVIRDGDQYLACRRTEERGGKWEFPGGKVEDGESHNGALVRELKEELGVDVLVGDRIIATAATGIRLTTYVAHLVDKRPTDSTDHDSLLWLPVDRLRALDWAAADIPTVELLIGGWPTEPRSA